MSNAKEASPETAAPSNNAELLSQARKVVDGIADKLEADRSLLAAATLVNGDLARLDGILQMLQRPPGVAQVTPLSAQAWVPAGGKLFAPAPRDVLPELASGPGRKWELEELGHFYFDNNSGLPLQVVVDWAPHKGRLRVSVALAGEVKP